MSFRHIAKHLSCHVRKHPLSLCGTQKPCKGERSSFQLEALLVALVSKRDASSGRSERVWTRAPPGRTWPPECARDVESDAIAGHPGAALRVGGSTPGVRLIPLEVVRMRTPGEPRMGTRQRPMPPGLAGWMHGRIPQRARPARGATCDDGCTHDRGAFGYVEGSPAAAAFAEHSALYNWLFQRRSRTLRLPWMVSQCARPKLEALLNVN